MSEKIGDSALRQPRRRLSTNLIRFAGLGLLALLLIRLDFERIRVTLRDADWVLVAMAASLVVPLIAIKAFRWQQILRSQTIKLAFGPALLVYFSSLFIGFLTPGRLGEFIKAIHVKRECGVPLSQAFSSVLADRLFDFYTLLIVGIIALFQLNVVDLSMESALLWGGFFIVVIAPLLLLVLDGPFGWIMRFNDWLGKWGKGQWLSEMRQGLLQLSMLGLLLAILLTTIAYICFFSQCYLIALALDISIGFPPIVFAVALGSLVTLLPVSISGLGTREAVIVAYLSVYEVSAQVALSFSLLVFLVFYVAGGVIGFGAWWIKPLPVKEWHTSSNDSTYVFKG